MRREDICLSGTISRGDLPRPSSRPVRFGLVDPLGLEPGPPPAPSRRFGFENEADASKAATLIKRATARGRK